MKKRIIPILSVMLGMVIGGVAVNKISYKKTDEVRLISDKHLALFLMMNQWVKVKQEGKRLEEYLKKVEYKNIAIYGMSYAGERLINELKNTDIHVLYGIDRNAGEIYSEIDVVSIDNELKNVDAVIVTAILFFDEIKEALSKKLNCPIISLEDVLYGM